MTRPLKTALLKRVLTLVVASVISVSLISPSEAKPRDWLSFLGRVFAPISAKDEAAMGRKLDDSVKQQYKVSSDQRMQACVSRVGKILAIKASHQTPFSFTLLDDPKTVNAFAGPGGYIYITTGLMNRLSHENQLAAVLGHEIAHVTHHHVTERIQEQVGTDVLLALISKATDKNLNTRLTQVSRFMVQQKFSRQDEFEADNGGLSLMTQAYYNPRGMVDMLNVLASLDSKSKLKLSMLQSHPDSALRAQRIAARIKAEKLGQTAPVVDTPWFLNHCR